MMALMYLGNQLPFAKGIKTLILKLKMLLKFLKVRKFKDWSAAQITNFFFKSQKLKAVYLAILADMVVRPTQFFGLGVPFFNVETAFDNRIPIQTKHYKLPTYHYIKNGCEQLVNVLADYIKSKGGKIYTNSKVTKIIIENNNVKGIILDHDEKIDADIVLASGGVLNIFYNLIGKDYLTNDLISLIENLTYMESVFFVNIGIDFDPSPYQRKALCYYYGTYDIEEAIDNCISGNYHEGKDGFLIYIPSMHSPEMAPQGNHAVTIYTIAPHKLKQGNWEDNKEEFAEKLLKEAEKYIPDLRTHIKTKVVLTPDDFQSRINVVRHSFGGLAPIIGQSGPQNYYFSTNFERVNLSC
ncbi:MAG: FAD-dependent oxidoreductase, partial [Candidatus Lokiarchaeota archaeon]